jgi:hypothetical protein
VKTVFQFWYETDVGPIFSTKAKAIEWYNKQADKDGEDHFEVASADGYGYPDLREFEVDTGYIVSKHKRGHYDR